MLAPCFSIVAEISSERLDPPGNLRGRDDRRKGGGGAVAARVGEGDRERTVAAHRMPEDGLPLEIGRKLRGDQFGKFLRHVTPHAAIWREGGLRGGDIKTCS